MNLYSLNEMYTEALEGAIDSETGEIKNDILAELLGEVGEELEKKALNIACFIKNLESDAAAIKAEMDALKNRRDHALKKSESLEKYLTSVLEGQKFKDARAEISWRKSSSVTVTADPEMLVKIRPDLVRTKYEPDKTAIKKAIEGGDLVVGCEIVTKQGLVIK
jgi:hypothetical protein